MIQIEHFICKESFEGVRFDYIYTDAAVMSIEICKILLINVNQIESNIFFQKVGR